jgi:hypothetical protein
MPQAKPKESHMAESMYRIFEDRAEFYDVTQGAAKDSATGEFRLSTKRKGI